MMCPDVLVDQCFNIIIVFHLFLSLFLLGLDTNILCLSV